MFIRVVSLVMVILGLNWMSSNGMRSRLMLSGMSIVE